MSTSISGNVLLGLILTRMLGIPVFLILLVLLFFFPALAGRYGWKSPGAKPESGPGVASTPASSLEGVVLIFFRTWIYLGLLGWVLLGATLLAGAGLIIFHDLAGVFPPHLHSVFGIFFNNLLPIGIGWLLIISGVWSGLYFRRNCENGVELLREKFRTYWYGLIAFTGLLLLVLGFVTMGVVLLLLALGPLRHTLFALLRRPKGETSSAGKRIFKDYESGGTRNPRW
jgi:hypothetical protein